MRNKIVIWVVALIFVFGGTSRADVVSLDLFSLGVPTEFYYDTPYWQTNFDLGVTFTQISHVYVRWSGEFTGGLIMNLDTQTTSPVDVGLIAWFSHPVRITSITGGKESYPSSEAFNYQSEIILSPSENWADIIDGTGTFSIENNYPIFIPESHYVFVEHGSVAPSSATLVIDGIVTPEPSTLVIFGVALPIFRCFTTRRKI